MKHLNEDNLAEQPAIAWFKLLGYEYEFGPDIAPLGSFQERSDFKEVLLLSRLERSIRRINPDLPLAGVQEAIRQLQHLQERDLVWTNKLAYKALAEHLVVEFKTVEGRIESRQVRFIDFENTTNNEFLIVNQFAVEGEKRVRRPDLVVFINGIPIAVFEFKNPTDKRGSIWDGYLQLGEYKQDIPKLFKYNQILAISDLAFAKYGTISATPEWYGAWKGITSEEDRPEGISQLEMLIRGLFDKERLLDALQNFIVFEADSEKDTSTFTKKMAMYHQYYGVNKAIERTIWASRPKGSRKIGVFWHTQGSGKSLSMVFYVNKVRRCQQLNSPALVFLTDRNDLDGQLYKVFLRSGYTQLAQQAETVKGLGARLQEAGSRIVFTTIQKFREKQGLLNDRENIIVIADEAHRSQYKKYAGNVRMALPNASFMGITGTPIDSSEKSTRMVFGPYISVYKINEAVRDEATVPIYYEGRLVPLHLTKDFIDEDFDDLVAEQGEGDEVMQRVKASLRRMEHLIGAPERIEQIAKDIVDHFSHRGIEGKGMVVTASRKIAVAMYRAMKQIKGAPEMAVVISNPQEFAGQIQPELDSHELERKFKKASDPLKLAIVCDMWLTGFDVPSLHTMYIDKPLKNHSLMQAIARVNRIYKDKPAGLVVDYIGVADNLKKALAIYASDVRDEAMVPMEVIIGKMLDKYHTVAGFLSGLDYGNWRMLDSTGLANLLYKSVNQVLGGDGEYDDGQRDDYLREVNALITLFGFVMPEKAANDIRRDVEFFVAVKNAILRLTTTGPGPTPPPIDVSSVVGKIIQEGIAATEAIDIFKTRKNGRPDISLFDEKFFEEIKKMKLKNLAAETLRKLLQDELMTLREKNQTRYGELLKILEDVIEKYENNIINSAEVIEKLIALAKELKVKKESGKKIGLSEEELAFYDAVSISKPKDLKNGELKSMVRELVGMVRHDLTVDWTNSGVITARIRANVRLMLLKHGYSVEQSESVMMKVFEQASALWRDYVNAATTSEVA